MPTRLRNLLPGWIGRPAHRLRERVRFVLRMRRLRTLLAELKATHGPEELELPLLQRIYDAWSNPGWTGDPGFLQRVAASAWKGPGPLLDCGSGLSTVVLAALASRYGGTVWSLEQNAEWYREVRRALRALGLENVKLWLAPLRSYGEYVWFDLGDRKLPAHFALVSCDGPAVMRSAWSESEFANWRVGAVLVLQNLGIRFDEVFLDDAEDQRCPALVERWRRAGVELEEVTTATGTMWVGNGPTATR